MSLKDFKIIAKLGEGAYSSVYKVLRLSDNGEYALKKVKLMNLSDKEKINALNEVRILASIRCQSIVGYKEAFLDEQSNSLCICMEYSNNGDLFQKICEYQKKGQLFSEQEIWHIFIQVVKGLKSLHDLRIFHRDLKSANVFLNKDGTVLLGDMNVSKVAKKGLLYTQTGTPYYASPEVWKDQPYDSKSDIWSLGCVLYELTTLKPPFRAEDMEGLFKKVIRGYYPRIPPHFSQDLSNVIRALLQVAPHLRPSADKILQLPAVIKRMNDVHFVEPDEGVPFLLNTIRIPKNMTNLSERMPKPNYTDLKTKKVEKHKFLSTLGQSNPEVSKSQESGIGGGSGLMLPKIGHKKNVKEIQQRPHPVKLQQQHNDDNHIGSDVGKDESMIHSPNKQKNGYSNHHRSKEELSEIRGGGQQQPHQNKQNNNNNNNNQYRQQQERGPSGHPANKQKKANPIQQGGGNHKLGYGQGADLGIVGGGGNNGNSITKKHKNASLHSKQDDQSYLYEQQEKQSQQELRKILDIHSIKKDKYDQQQQQERSNIHQIYKAKPKRYESNNNGINKYKQKQQKYNILDIEGESKPIMHKGYRIKQQQQQQQQNHISSLNPQYDDDKSKLPQLGGRLPKINGGSNSQDNGKMLPMIQGQGKGGVIGGGGQGGLGQEKDGAKIREISRAYKVNIGHLDELKERYRQIKRMENQKRDKYKDYGINKNASLPHARIEKASYQQNYNDNLNL